MCLVWIFTIPGIGARGRNRTGTGGLGPRDFKSLVSTNFTTRAKNGGGGRNRTGVDGFAGRCMTTLPPRHDCLYKNWSGKRGSNSRPQPWQGCALPLSYSRAMKLPKDLYHFRNKGWIIEMLCVLSRNADCLKRVNRLYAVTFEKNNLGIV